MVNLGAVRVARIMIRLQVASFQFGRGLSIMLFCLLPSTAFAVNIPQWWKDVHHYTADRQLYSYLTYSTAYFGPNALPVPELYDGRIQEKHQVEVSVDAFWGFGDETQSISSRLTYVPIPGKLSISCWSVLAEHYKTTTAVRDQRASIVESGEETLLIGDAYLSTLYSVFKEKRICPDVNLEFVLKTASSKTPYGARFFDTPGYWFDVTAGKSFLLPGSFVREIRFVGLMGFLSYQMNSSFQNDAPLFGGKMVLFSKNASFENGINGYSGWMDRGDSPLVLRSKLNFMHDRMKYFVQFQYALRDYPYYRIQTGVCFDLK